MLLAASPAQAATWYVSGAGNDSNPGNTPREAFRTLQMAANEAWPGDTVMAMNGTYATSCDGCDVVKITQSGTASAPIIFCAYPGQTPVINSTNAWAAFEINSAYITIEGFTIAGGEAAVSKAYAEAKKNNLNNYRTSGNGIVVDNFVNGAIPHHVIIEDNIVHDEPGAGISTNYADYITIEHNTTYRNAFWSPYANSGISIYEMRDIDSYTGYKNFIEDNVSYSNHEYIPFYATGTITDGNGIIVDDNKNTQSDNQPYGGRSYVANNIVHLNGGSGIHAYDSAHVDIVYNTAYMNNQTPSNDGGQIFSNTGSDVNILDNILDAPTGKPVASNGSNDATVLFDYNLLFGANKIAALNGAPTGPHDIFGVPYFASANSANFKLTAASPAIGAGTASLAPSTDFDGNPRPTANGGYDLGAYQYIPDSIAAAHAETNRSSKQQPIF